MILGQWSLSKLLLTIKTDLVHFGERYLVPMWTNAAVEL
jgi:hypothetical protein